MKQPTMVYRKASEDAVHVIDTEAGLVEWQIVDLDDGEDAPDGWSRSFAVADAAPAPRKSKKVKADDGNSDGNQPEGA